MEADLATRRATLETALNKIQYDNFKISILNIETEAQRKYYDKITKENNEAIAALQTKIDAILAVQVFTFKLYSNIFDVVADPIVIKGTDTTVPRITFKLYYKNGREETEAVYHITICGIEIEFEHNGRQFVEISRKGEYYIPSNNENIRIRDGNERDGDYEFECFNCGENVKIKLGDTVGKCENKYCECNYVVFTSDKFIENEGTVTEDNFSVNYKGTSNGAYFTITTGNFITPSKEIRGLRIANDGTYKKYMLTEGGWMDSYGGLYQIGFDGKNLSTSIRVLKDETNKLSYVIFGYFNL